MFAARCGRVSNVWVAVGLTRQSNFAFKGIRVAVLRCVASRSAWLNSRYRCFTGYNGTGTMKSQSGRRKAGRAWRRNKSVRNGSNQSAR